MIAGVPAARTSSVDTRIIAYRDGVARERVDRLTVEEPLEIRLRSGRETRRAAVTMRTPGADLELAAGFVLGERIVPGRDAIAGIVHCEDGSLSPDERGNVVTVSVRGPLAAGALLERHFTISSACGVCGSGGIELLRARGFVPIESDVRIEGAVLATLPERMRARQNVFAATGGLHAAALFDCDGRLLDVREDVGRHNAVDKIVGALALLGRTDPGRTVLAVSGRCGYEIVQKALAAGIPVVASVSAPSSLAVSLARAFGVTLAGFVREGRWNAYAAPERIVGSGPV